MKFGKEQAEQSLSLLREGVEVVGEIAFATSLRVDGVIRGRLRSEGTLVVGPKGRVEAEVLIRRVTIDGEFRGTIRASERVEIRRDGKVYGDIFTPCLIIEAGALFEGKCNMTDDRGAKEEGPALLKVVESSN